MLIFILIGYILKLSFAGLKLSSIESEEARPWFDLVELGANISRIMDKPVPPGHAFIRDLFVYWENLEYVLNSIQNNGTRGMEVYKRLKKHGGPKHTHLEIKGDLYLKTFDNWDQRDIKEVYGIINDTQTVWNDIQACCKGS